MLALLSSLFYRDDFPELAELPELLEQAELLVLAELNLHLTAGVCFLTSGDPLELKRVNAVAAAHPPLLSA